MQLVSPVLCESAHTAAMTQILVTMWTHILASHTYSATAAGLELDLSSDAGSSCIVLLVSGFSCKAQELVLDAVRGLSHLSQLVEDEAEGMWGMARESLLRLLSNDWSLQVRACEL